MTEIPEDAVTAAAGAIADMDLAGSVLDREGPAYRRKAVAVAVLEAATPHILADFSERTAGMAEALNSAAAIIEDRDRQLTRVRKFADGTLHEGGELQEALLKILDGDGNG